MIRTNYADLTDGIAGAFTIQSVSETCKHHRIHQVFSTPVENDRLKLELTAGDPANVSPMDRMPNLPGYEILEKVGEGAMAVMLVHRYLEQL